MEPCVELSWGVTEFLKGDCVFFGQDLIDDIDAAAPPEGSLAFWWLGQHGYVCKMGGRILYFDPYLKPDERRRIKPLLKPEQVAHADIVLCTHDHTDHIDPTAIPGLVQASPDARFVVSRRHRDRMLSLCVPEGRLLLLDPGQTVVERGLRITGVKQKHEFFDNDERGWPFMGFVVEGGGATVYHSGDTVLYEGMVATLRQWDLTVMFVPINGRDAERYRRNVLGNMTYQEAVDLAGELRPQLVVPAHYEMLPGNTENPGRFLDYLHAKFPGQRAWVGRHGERVEAGRG